MSSEFALAWVECSSGCFDLLQQDCFQSLVVFCLVFTEDKDIVHKAQNTIKWGENLAHPLLEMFWSARDAEWHFIKAITAEGSDEGGEESGSLGKWDLPEPC